MPDSIDNHIACDKHCEFVDDILPDDNFTKP
jgi:hypothetical protein